MARPIRPAAAMLAAAAALLGPGLARAHVTPPVELVPEGVAVSSLLGGAKVSVREVRLSKADRAALKRRTGGSPDGNRHRVLLGHDAAGRLVGAVVLLTEYTTHGAVRLAVGLGPDGRVSGASVVEVSEEAHRWVRPLVDHDFAQDYVGQDASGRFALTERLERAVTGELPRFYGRVLTSLLQRAALVFELGFLERREGAASGAGRAP